MHCDPLVMLLWIVYGYKIVFLPGPIRTLLLQVFCSGTHSLHSVDLVEYLLLSYLQYKILDDDIDVVVSFDEYGSTQVLHGIMELQTLKDALPLTHCVYIRLESVLAFYKKLLDDADKATEKMRSGCERAMDGDSMAEYCEWSYQMWLLGTICQDLPFWICQPEFDEEDDPEYTICINVLSLLMQIVVYLLESLHV